MDSLSIYDSNELFNQQDVHQYLISQLLFQLTGENGRQIFILFVR